MGLVLLLACARERARSSVRRSAPTETVSRRPAHRASRSSGGSRAASSPSSAQIGLRGYFLRDIGRAFGDPATFVPETIRQMRGIGVDSIPLTVIVAAFIGGVIALQTRYQLFPGVQLSIIGLSVRLMQVLELGPLLTGLVLTGPRRRAHDRGDRHDARDRADRRARDAVVRPARVPRSCRGCSRAS